MAKRIRQRQVIDHLDRALMDGRLKVPGSGQDDQIRIAMKGTRSYRAFFWYQSEEYERVYLGTVRLYDAVNA
jgi:hypothetical protein